ncbi:MAG: type II secretion system F family protein [Candidatus Bruticola sp.]
MPIYQYQAQTRDGKIINSTIEAVNLNLAIDTLTSSKLKIIEITPQKFNPLGFLGDLKSLKRESVVMMTRRMVALVKGGLSMDRALTVLHDQEEDPKLKPILAQVLHDVRVGSTVSWAMSKHPDAFDTLYVSMIKVGETTGDIGSLLDRLAGFLERDLNIRQKAKSAMTYPTLILVFSILVIAGIFFYIMPPLLDVFTQMSVGTDALPLPTKIMFFLTNLTKNPLTYLTIALLAIYYMVFVRSYLESPTGKFKFDKFKLTVPIFGELNKKLLVAQFCRILSTLLATGVPVVKSLEIIQDFSGNDYFKEVIIIPLIDGIKEGQAMSSILEDSKFFPSMVQSMMAVGETTGEMPRMLSRVSDFYDKEVVYALEGMLSLLEPVMIGGMGMMVCFILLSVFLPLYQSIMNMNA